MVEHGVPAGEQVIGYAFDGTGYGTDGAIWGGEVLLAGYDGFERAAHLRVRPPAGRRRRHPQALPGGSGPPVGGRYRAGHPTSRRSGRRREAELGVLGAPARARCAVRAHLEHGPALRCRQLAHRAAPHRLLRGPGGDRARGESPTEHLDGGPALPLRRRQATRSTRPRCCGRSSPTSRAGCRPAPSRPASISPWPGSSATCADRLRRQTGLDRVALSGGVFQNVLLVRLARAELGGRGLEVLTHRLVPPNDGGLALGSGRRAGRRPERVGEA